MYEIMKLEDRLQEVNKEISAGNANKALLEESFEIQMALDNLLWMEII